MSSPAFFEIADAPAPWSMPVGRMLEEEWRTALLLPRLLRRIPQLRRAPRGDGGVVIVIPGWKAPELSMAPLKRYLTWLGYDARDWGLGTNRGNPERDALLLGETVAAIHAETARHVSLVGWSLGGCIAREVAREGASHVRTVVTYGTPAVGGPTFTVGARAFGPAECVRVSELIGGLDRERPITVPMTAIFTRRDHIVSWPSCIDHASPNVEHIEVRSTHLGMGIDPEVWRVVAEALAKRRE